MRPTASRRGELSGSVVPLWSPQGREVSQLRPAEQASAFARIKPSQKTPTPTLPLVGEGVTLRQHSLQLPDAIRCAYCTLPHDTPLPTTPLPQGGRNPGSTKPPGLLSWPQQRSPTGLLVRVISETAPPTDAGYGPSRPAPRRYGGWHRPLRSARPRSAGSPPGCG